MAIVKIKKSVGKNGKNDAEDTRKIQELLNVHKGKGGYATLVADGDAGKKTIAAITAFQTKVMGVKADGRVDVDGATLAALNAKPGTVAPPPDPKPTSGGTSTKKPATGGGAKGSTGDISEIQKRIAVITESITETQSAIDEQNSVSDRLRSYETVVEQMLAEAKQGIGIAKEPLEAKNDQRRAKVIDKLRKAVDKAALCMINAEKEADSIQGAKCDRGLGVQLKKQSEQLGFNSMDSKKVAELDATLASLDRLATISLGALTLIRVANEAYILILKGKLLVHEKALEWAEKDLKALA